jgi:hypothetical protein
MTSDNELSKELSEQKSRILKYCLVVWLRFFLLGMFWAVLLWGISIFKDDPQKVHGLHFFGMWLLILFTLIGVFAAVRAYLKFQRAVKS